MSGTLLLGCQGKMKPQARMTHGGRLGVLWRGPGVNGSGSGAILNARPD